MNDTKTLNNKIECIIRIGLDIDGQLLKDWHGQIDGVYSVSVDLRNSKHELQVDARAKSDNNVPDRLETKILNEEINVRLVDLENINGSLATRKKNHLDLSESLFDVDRSLRDVVDDVVHQLAEDRGDLVPDGSASEEELKHHGHKVIVESATDVNNRVPQLDETEAESLLKGSGQ